MPSLYVHIPFCERKCPYCDFYSVEGGVLVERFLAALRHESQMRARDYHTWRFTTLYLGGGTPSMLSGEAMEGLLGDRRNNLRIEPASEVTVEVNPGTVTEEKLQRYRAAGINRLSIGIQSFREQELMFLGRIHTSGQARETVELARRAGFTNISIDLIYSLPGQTPQDWEYSVRSALALGPEHISAYSLIIESGTPFSLAVERGTWTPNTDEQEAHLFEHTMELLERAGYEHYEVSNYARPGFRSAHNANYWTHESYLGLGPSAHSFSAGAGREGLGTRWWNLPALGSYLQSLEAGKLPVGSHEDLDRTMLINERILLGLRSGGVALEMLEEAGTNGQDGGRRSVVRTLVEEGLAESDSNTLRLTRRGFLVCDEIARRLMVG